MSLENIIKDLRHLKIAANASTLRTDKAKLLIQHTQNNLIDVESDSGKYSQIEDNIYEDDQ